MTLDDKRIERALENSDKLLLFLDYDGTLADFSKHPDIVEPNPEVLLLIEALIACKNIQTAVISGRRLEHLQKLLPFDNIFLAGTYGLEIQKPGGNLLNPLDYKTIQPELERLKQEWESLIDDHPSFYLEDKGWTLAIHARYVENHLADEVLNAAENIANKNLDASIFKVNLGHKFLEASPLEADKKECVRYLMEIIPVENAALFYLGDDDKDEQAFEVVQSHGGFAVRVCSNVINNPIEDWRLENPKAARKWLWELYDRFC